MMIMMMILMVMMMMILKVSSSNIVHYLPHLTLVLPSLLHRQVI